jgi:hypothetical protein
MSLADSLAILRLRLNALCMTVFPDGTQLWPILLLMLSALDALEIVGFRQRSVPRRLLKQSINYSTFFAEKTFFTSSEKENLLDPKAPLFGSFRPFCGKVIEQLAANPE